VLEPAVNKNTTLDTFTDRPLTTVTGRDFEAAQLQVLVAAIILLGKCTCKEAGKILRRKYRRVDLLDTCRRCDDILAMFEDIRELGVCNCDATQSRRQKLARNGGQPASSAGTLARAGQDREHRQADPRLDMLLTDALQTAVLLDSNHSEV
jgi:hypothetical protein